MKNEHLYCATLTVCVIIASLAYAITHHYERVPRVTSGDSITYMTLNLWTGQSVKIQPVQQQVTDLP